MKRNIGHNRTRLNWQQWPFSKRYLAIKKLAATLPYFARSRLRYLRYIFYEPFGLAPIEAAAAGLAPVVTKWRSIRKFFRWF